MADKMIIEISADGKQAESVISSLRKEIGNLEAQALKMTSSLGKGSSGLVDQFGVPIGQIKSALNDVNQVTNKTAGGFAAFKTAIVNGIQNPMAAAAGGAEKLLTALGPVGVGLAAVATIAIAVAKPLVEMTLAAGKAAEQTLNMADRLGISGVEMKKLSAMAQIAGVDIGVLEGSTRILATALEDSSGAGAKAYKAMQSLGIVTREGSGAEREYGKVMLDLLDTLGSVEDANKRAMLATQVFGRGAKELLPMIKNWQELKQAAENIGYGKGTDEGLRALAKMDDEVDKLELVWKMFKSNLAKKIEPILVSVIVAIKKTMTGEIFGVGETAIDKADRDAMEKAKAADKVAEAAANKSFYDRDMLKYKGKIGITEDDIKGNIDQLKGDLKKQRDIFGDINVFEDARANAFREMQSLQKQIGLKEAQLKSMERARADRERAPEYTAGLLAAAKDAENKDLTGVFKAEYDYQKNLEKLKTDRQDTPQNRVIVERQYQAERLKAEKDFNKLVWDMQNKSMTDSIAAYKKQNMDRLLMEIDTQLKMADIIRDNETRLAEFTITKEQKTADERKNQELAALEGINAVTVPQKIALEQAKLAIEKRHIDESLRLEIKKLELIRDKTIELLQAQKLLGNDAQAAEIQKAIDSIKNTSASEIDAAKQTAEDKKNTETVKAASNTAKIVRDEWQKTYDTIKRASEGVFDAMLSKSTSIWQAMADSFKNIFLTAFKEIVSSTVARSLAGLFSGGSPNGQNGQSKSGGILDSIRGIFGGNGQNGATPPFFPSNGTGVAMAGGLAATPSGGRWVMDSAGKMTQIAKGSSGIAKFLGQDGSGIMGTASAKGMFGQSGMFGKAGGAVQGGLIMGGSMLAMDGWKRGGAAGMAEMTGGGAAIGLAVGGPLGAAIGAGVGAIVGGLHWAFGKNPNEEMKKRVLAITGVKIDSKDTLKTLVASYKASGVKLDDFIKSKQAADIISLYAMSTNQKYSNPYNLGQFAMQLNNGNIYEQASYMNGSSNAALSSLPGLGFSNSLDQISGGMASGGTQNITLQLDAEATKQVLEGKAADVIQGNPRLVNAANNKAMSQNSGRIGVVQATSPTAILA